MKALLLAVTLLMLAACTPKATAPASAKTERATTAKSYLGSWDVTISDTPMGTVSGVLTLAETNGQLGGTFSGQGTTFPLTKAAVTDTGMRASFYYPDAQTDVEIVLNGDKTADTLTGMTMGDFATTAKRKG